MFKKIMKDKQMQQAIVKLGETTKIIPTPDVLQFFNLLSEAYKENQITSLESDKLQAQKEVALLQIKSKYNLYHQVFDSIFDERKAAISKSFEIIDRGLELGNNEMVNTGMQGLSKIVSSSPFANMQQLSNALEGRNIIEI